MSAANTAEDIRVAAPGGNEKTSRYALSSSFCPVRQTGRLTSKTHAGDDASTMLKRHLTLIIKVDKFLTMSPSRVQPERERCAGTAAECGEAVTVANIY